jgi:hypothetical protein
MTTAVRGSTAKQVPVNSMRKTALAAGVLYLLTFVIENVMTAEERERIRDQLDASPGIPTHQAD